jgi:hypothetical protein
LVLLAVWFFTATGTVSASNGPALVIAGDANLSMAATPTFAPTPAALAASAESSAILGAGTPIPPHIFLPAVNRQATPTHTSTPRPEWLSEEWRCGDFPLETGDTYIQRCGEDQGTYEIHRLNISHTQAWARDRWGASRMAFQANVQLLQGKAHYHIFFNNTMYMGFYSFGVNPVDRTWALWRVDQETNWVPLQDWTRSDHIHSGSEVNVLRIERNNEAITVFVNGQPLGTFNDWTYTGSYWGVYTRNSQTNSIIHYSNIITQYHSSIVATPTPKPPWQYEDYPCRGGNNNLESNETTAYTHECVDDWTMAMRHPAPFNSVADGDPTFDHDDYSIEASVALTKGAGEYHIAFNGYGLSQYYAYGVNPANGTYSLGKVTLADSGGDIYRYAYETISGWKSSPHVRRGNASNQLRLVYENLEYRFYVNDQLVAVTKWRDLEPLNNNWGLYISTTQADTEVVYSNVQIQTR